MSSPHPRPSGDKKTGAEGEEPTGLPFFKTWRDVYGYVFASFVIVVLLLAIFTWTYSG